MSQENYHNSNMQEAGPGLSETRLNGNEYLGKFTGLGYISGDSECSVLADARYNDISKPNRKLLNLSDLFPSEWAMDEQHIEYEITVKAKLVEPPQK